MEVRHRYWMGYRYVEYDGTVVAGPRSAVDVWDEGFASVRLREELVEAVGP